MPFGGLKASTLRTAVDSWCPAWAPAEKPACGLVRPWDRVPPPPLEGPPTFAFEVARPPFTLVEGCLPTLSQLFQKIFLSTCLPFHIRSSNKPLANFWTDRAMFFSPPSTLFCVGELVAFIVSAVTSVKNRRMVQSPSLPDDQNQLQQRHWYVQQPFLRHVEHPTHVSPSPKKSLRCTWRRISFASSSRKHKCVGLIELFSGSLWD